MVEFIKKLYIDSRFRTSTSNSTSDFEVELAQAVHIPRRAIGWVTDLHLPVTWYNIDSHNDTLYVEVFARMSGVDDRKVRTATLLHKNYTGETLCAAINNSLNTLPCFANTRFFLRYVPEEGTMWLCRRRL